MLYLRFSHSEVFAGMFSVVQVEGLCYAYGRRSHILPFP